MYHLQQNYHQERGKSNESSSEVAPYNATSMPNLVGRERGSALNQNQPPTKVLSVCEFEMPIKKNSTKQLNNEMPIRLQSAKPPLKQFKSSMG